MRTGEHASEDPVDDTLVANDDATDLLAQYSDLFLEALDARLCPLCFTHCLSLPWPNQLEVATHVETVPRGDLVLIHHALRHRLVVRVHLLVAAPHEPSLRCPVDHLARRFAFPGIDPSSNHVFGLAFQLGVVTGDLVI